MVELEGPTTMSEINVKEEWLRREAVVAEIKEAGGSASLAMLTRLAEKGKLHPRCIEGVNYYDPQEVALVVEEKVREATSLKSPEGQREATSAYLLDTSRAMLALIRDPRERIDDIQFKIIDTQQKRIEELEKKLDTQRVATELALDSTLERNLAIEQVKTEGRIKEVAAGRMVETISKLMGGMGKAGVALSPEQLEELLLANADGGEPFLTKEQETQAKAIVAQAKAKTNGKATVAGVAKAVKETVEAKAES